MSAPKAVIFDLDGTLTVSKTPMTVEIGELLGRLVERVPVGVMSGGSYEQFLKQFLPDLLPEAHLEKLYLFPTSAARCYAYTNGAWRARYNHELSGDERAEVMKAFDESLAVAGLATPPAKVWGDRIEDRGSQITFSGLGQQAPPEEKKKWDPDQSKRRPLKEALEQRLPDFSIRMNAASSIDITHQGIDKAYGVRQFSEMLDIPITDMLYIGDALFDGGNDAVVKEVGIPTRQVAGPDEAATVIKELLVEIPFD